MDIERAKTHQNVAILLTLSGGFLDAFTFIAHQKVFANTMTGNVVLLAVNLAGGDFHQASRHLSPLVGFVFGILAAHLLQLTATNRLPHPVIIALVLETAYLGLASSHMVGLFWLIPGISFVATLQSIIFTHAGKQPYSSVMTTTNLRRTIQLFFESTILHWNAAGVRDAGALGAISLSFALGALLGALTTRALGDAALWVPSAPVLAALLETLRHAVAKSSPERAP
ncbi:YoaK family protein [Paraburkholderia sp. MM5477-R1]|uniref:YoaK family protein n=1 Tax=Paraburkholderia sp. MM5477-R1 TaxID=2991062 RepID=UPI003D201085